MNAKHTELGSYLRELRTQKDWALETAAEKLGCHFTTVSHIELGRIHCSDDMIGRFSDLYGVPKPVLLEKRAKDDGASKEENEEEQLTTPTATEGSATKKRRYIRKTSSRRPGRPRKVGRPKKMGRPKKVGRPPKAATESLTAAKRRPGRPKKSEAMAAVGSIQSAIELFLEATQQEKVYNLSTAKDLYEKSIEGLSPNSDLREAANTRLDEISKLMEKVSKKRGRPETHV